jgi:hypothetical protein
MTWNVDRVGEVRAAAMEMFPDHQIKLITPIAHAHINMLGVLIFDMSKHRVRLLVGRAVDSQRSASAR